MNFPTIFSSTEMSTAPTASASLIKSRSRSTARASHRRTRMLSHTIPRYHCTLLGTRLHMDPRRQNPPKYDTATAKAYAYADADAAECHHRWSGSRFVTRGSRSRPSSVRLVPLLRSVPIVHAGSMSALQREHSMQTGSQFTQRATPSKHSPSRPIAL